MARGVNKVILVGNLGQDPQTRAMPSGKTVVNLRIATTDQWRDKQTGENKENTEWHTVVAWSRLAEICGEYLKKGRQVYIEGSLQTRQWEDKDGNTRYSTEIKAREMQMLGGRDGGGGDDSYDQSPRPQRQSTNSPRPQPAASGGGDGYEFTPDDDLPF